MEDRRFPQQSGVDVLRAEPGIGPAKEKALVGVRGGQGQEVEGRPGFLVEAQPAGIDGVLPENRGQAPAEAVVADLAHESRLGPQPRRRHGDVGGGSARDRQESGNGGELRPLFRGEHVHQQLAQAYDRHWPAPGGALPQAQNIRPGFSFITTLASRAMLLERPSSMDIRGSSCSMEMT